MMKIFFVHKWMALSVGVGNLLHLMNIFQVSPFQLIVLFTFDQTFSESHSDKADRSYEASSSSLNSGIMALTLSEINIIQIDGTI
jgi:hypothetical protein